MSAGQHGAIMADMLRTLPLAFVHLGVLLAPGLLAAFNHV
jgi:hypothetical protein